MLDDCKVTNDNYKSQKMSEKEKDNWVSIEDIQTLYDGLLAKIKLMFSGNKVVDYPTIMEFFLISFLGGVSGLPPRRSYENFKL